MNDSSVEDKLARSLSSGAAEIIPYLPYLLRDLWELGSSPRDMLEMLKAHTQVSPSAKVLDLACGKGAVSILLAKELACRVRGIDLMPEFIAEAEQKAREWGVCDLCTFLEGDIIQAVESERDHDIVILGAVGDVLGDPGQTLALLTKTVKGGGYILIDDGYGNDPGNEVYHTRAQWLRFIAKAGVELISEKPVGKEDLASINREQLTHIINRAEELKTLHPEKVSLFDGYIESQQAECIELENEITGVTLLLRTQHGSGA